MNANIVKMHIFYKIKYDIRGHSRSQIMTFLIKNSFLFRCPIDQTRKAPPLWLDVDTHEVDYRMVFL